MVLIYISLRFRIGAVKIQSLVYLDRLGRERDAERGGERLEETRVE